VPRVVLLQRVKERVMEQVEQVEQVQRYEMGFYGK
jgi:hypothetical protein